MKPGMDGEGIDEKKSIKVKTMLRSNSSGAERPFLAGKPFLFVNVADSPRAENKEGETKNQTQSRSRSLRRTRSGDDSRRSQSADTALSPILEDSLQALHANHQTLSEAVQDSLSNCSTQQAPELAEMILRELQTDLKLAKKELESAAQAISEDEWARHKSSADRILRHAAEVYRLFCQGPEKDDLKQEGGVEDFYYVLLNFSSQGLMDKEPDKTPSVRRGLITPVQIGGAFSDFKSPLPDFGGGGFIYPSALLSYEQIEIRQEALLNLLLNIRKQMGLVLGDEKATDETWQDWLNGVEKNLCRIELNRRFMDESTFERDRNILEGILRKLSTFFQANQPGSVHAPSPVGLQEAPAPVVSLGRASFSQRAGQFLFGLFNRFLMLLGFKDGVFSMLHEKKLKEDLKQLKQKKLEDCTPVLDEYLRVKDAWLAKNREPREASEHQLMGYLYLGFSHRDKLCGGKTLQNELQATLLFPERSLKERLGDVQARYKGSYRPQFLYAMHQGRLGQLVKHCVAVDEEARNKKVSFK